MNNFELKEKGFFSEDVFIADGVQVSGAENIELGKDVNIWYNSVLRAGEFEIKVGDRTNIQDGSVIHISNKGGTYIGSDVTVGHMALIHGCTIGDRTLIGMGSIIMNEAKIGSECIVGAGTLVTKGKEFADGTLIMGSPAREVRKLTALERAALKGEAEEYVTAAKKEISALKR